MTPGVIQGGREFVRGGLRGFGGGAGGLRDLRPSRATEPSGTGRGGTPNTGAAPMSATMPAPTLHPARAEALPSARSP